MALARRRGWTTRAEVSEKTGVAASTLSRWEAGSGGRGDAFDRIEQALEIPGNTLARILVGDLDIDDVLAQMSSTTDESSPQVSRFQARTVNMPDDLLADLQSEAADDYARIRRDHIDDARTKLERAGAQVEDGGMADLIARHGDREFIVEVKSGRPVDDDEIVRDVGRAAELAAIGKTLLLYALVDWPDEAVGRVERLGGVYTTPADLPKVLVEDTTE